jgi:hypothetical protein
LLIAYIFNAAGADRFITPLPVGARFRDRRSQVMTTGFFGRYNIFYKIASSESGNYLFTHELGSQSTCGPSSAIPASILRPV